MADEPAVGDSPTPSSPTSPTIEARRAQTFPLLGDDDLGLHLARTANRSGLLGGSASDAAEMILRPGHRNWVMTR